MLYKIFESIKLVVKELFVPSEKDESPYTALVIGIGHAMVGAAIITMLPANLGAASVIGLTIARFTIAIFYWLLKESGDIKRGGNFLDGLKDSAWVLLGGWYGATFWPQLVLFIAFIEAVSIQYKQLGVKK